MFNRMSDYSKKRDTEIAMPSEDCCENEYEYFQPGIIMCRDTIGCTIAAYEKYFSYEHRYNICKSCFDDIEEDSVTLENEVNMNEKKIDKTEFKYIENNQRIPEPFVKCLECGKIQHEICVLHLDRIWPHGFRCDACLKMKSIKKAENIYTSQNLTKTKLSCHIEERVNRLLQLKEATSCIVNVRVVSSFDSIVRISEAIEDRFAGVGHCLEDMPYRSKMIMAFQVIDGVDVCFFAMSVQEYDSECPAPNSGKAYIEFIDSVNFFTHKHLRTDVYHEIFLGYLEHIKLLGYTSVHIWSAAPEDREDYIFNYRPEDQKMPTNDQLKEWYCRALNKGINEKTVIKYEQKLELNKESLCAFPLFNGYFWSKLVEDTVRELNEEEDEQDQVETNSVEVGNGEVMNSDVEVNDTNKIITSEDYSFIERLIENAADVDISCNLFIIYLNCEEICENVRKIVDPDPLDIKYIVKDNLSFLASSSQRHLEFNSLRKAKYSTMVLIYNLHQHDDQLNFKSCCSICQVTLLDIGYTCKECNFYKLCLKCFSINVHPHEMVEDRFIPQVQEVWAPNKHDISSYPLHYDWFVTHIQMIYHAYYCEDNDCKFTWCIDVLSDLTCLCLNESLGGCSDCSPVMDLCKYHSQHCTQLSCEIPSCIEIQFSAWTARDRSLLNKYNQLLTMKYHAEKNMYRLIILLSSVITSEKFTSTNK